LLFVARLRCCLRWTLFVVVAFVTRCCWLRYDLLLLLLCPLFTFALLPAPFVYYVLCLLHCYILLRALRLRVLRCYGFAVCCTVVVVTYVVGPVTVVCGCWRFTLIYVVLLRTVDVLTLRTWPHALLLRY